MGSSWCHDDSRWTGRATEPRETGPRRSGVGLERRRRDRLEEKKRFEERGAPSRDENAPVLMRIFSWKPRPAASMLAGMASARGEAHWPTTSAPPAGTSAGS